MLKKNYSSKHSEVGCDESGRGCLAGPVVAAAVILPKNYNNKLLNDSKKITANQREILYNQIILDAKSYSIEEVSNRDIDKINILNSSFLAMHKAIDKINSSFNLLLIDGNKFKAYKNIKHVCVVKGDGKYQSIAAASILAKVHRDLIMENLHLKFPYYHWNKNKGYPTKQHRQAIIKHGISIYHRKSFKLFEKQLKINFT